MASISDWVVHKTLDYNATTTRSLFRLLLGVSDAKFNFTTIDVGAFGREGDSSIFKNSLDFLSKDQKWYSWNTCNTNHCAVTSETTNALPPVLLRDEAFGLTRQVMQTIYCCRPSYDDRRKQKYWPSQVSYFYQDLRAEPCTLFEIVDSSVKIPIPRQILATFWPGPTPFRKLSGIRIRSFSKNFNLISVITSKNVKQFQGIA